MEALPHLFNKRILSIDAFRGITIFTMIFVNEVASITHVPQWLRHMPADADGMTFVDLVFPAFLFIVGMSIPFAFNARLKKGHSHTAIWQHTLKRSFALLVMGIYMVNADSGYNNDSMLIPIALWGMLAYSLPIPVWNKYPKTFPAIWKKTIQYLGIAGYLALYFLYVRTDGSIGITPRWWGILGLLGWAYLLTALCYWLAKGKLSLLIGCFAGAMLLNIFHVSPAGQTEGLLWFRYVTGHMGTTAMALAGVITSLLFFNRHKFNHLRWDIIGFAAAVFMAGYFLQPYFEVSKIRGTPSWCLYSIGWCITIYYLLYWIIEVEKTSRWSHFFMPAAANPLLMYVLPGIIIYFNRLFELQVIPTYFTHGLPGILWSLLFTVIMLYLVRVFNRFHIQLHL